jgi:hypothetical protein
MPLFLLIISITQFVIGYFDLIYDFDKFTTLWFTSSFFWLIISGFMYLHIQIKNLKTNYHERV